MRVGHVSRHGCMWCVSGPLEGQTRTHTFGGRFESGVSERKTDTVARRYSQTLGVPATEHDPGQEPSHARAR